MDNSSYKIFTLGCKVNQYDSVSLGEKLENAGFIAVGQDADVVIVNTCAVTRSAITKDRQMITKARKENPRARFIVCGCWPRVYQDEADRFGVDLVWNSKDYDKLAAEIVAQTGQLTNQPACASHVMAHDVQAMVRRFVKVQDGCRQFCAYCIIPYARGELSSRQSADVIAEIRQLIENGVKEIVLCGIHLGLYGVDFKDGNERIDLAGLIENVLKIDGLVRLRLSSIEINEVNDRILTLMKTDKKFCHHLHIPLQGGSDKVLKAMNRPYTQVAFLEKIAHIKQIVPDAAFNTDIIVGFPGETEADFQETIAMAEKIGFSRLHVFPFSVHEKTPAATMPDPVDKPTITDRAERLRQVGEKLKEQFRQKYVGQEMAVLVENKTGNNMCHGKTEYYFDVDFKKDDITVKTGEDDIIGSIVKVRIL